MGWRKNLLYDPLDTIFANVENFLIQCGKVENFCGKVENYHMKVRGKYLFFRASSFFATKVATPLLLMNWKGYGFFRARLKKVTDFFFNCVHSKQLHI